jgi:periplasmic protein TonB
MSGSSTHASDATGWRAAALSTENARFKAGYPVYMRWALLVSFVVFTLVFLFSPVLVIDPYTLTEDTIEVIDIPDAIDIPPPPEELPKPQVPIEAAPDAEVEDDVEIADTLVEDFSDFNSLPTGGAGGSGNGFVAFDTKPEIINYVKPKYSEFAREAGLEGTVMIDVLVGTDGRVKEARISRSVHSALDSEALVAARRAVFSPGKQREIPVEVWVTLPYNFTLF